MKSEEKFASLIEMAESLLNQHANPQKIEEILRIDKNVSDADVTQIMQHIKKIYYASKRKRGGTIILVGSVLLLIGFILTVANFHSNTSFQYIMYGFTSAGLLIIFAGLYDIFG